MDDSMNSHANQQDQTSSGSESLGTSTKALIEQADQLLKATSSLSGDAITALRSKLTDSLAGARAELTHLQQMARQRSEKAVADGRQYVQQKPLQAIACAALTGLFLGWMAARSGRS